MEQPQSTWNNHDRVDARSTSEYSCPPSTSGTPEEVGRNFTDWVASHTKHLELDELDAEDGYDGKSLAIDPDHYDYSYLFQLRSDWTSFEGCSVSVTAWLPDTCQGRSFSNYTMRFIPSPLKDIIPFNSYDESDSDIVVFLKNEAAMNAWKAERGGIGPFDPADEAIIRKGFDCLFHIVMNSDIRVLQVESLGHELAFEILCPKLQANKELKHFEFDKFENEEEKVLTLDRCIEVLSKSSLTELFFRSIHQYNQEQINQLLQAVGGNCGLESLDLRASRRIHTWSKDSKLTAANADHFPPGGISLEPLIAALKFPDNGFTLKKLDLSGLILSTASVLELAKELPGLGLETLLLRDTALDPAALTAIVRAIKEDKSLKKLDLSHNTFTDDIMHELCASLREHQFLMDLKLELCGISFDQVETLARALPDLKSPRCLYLDGNEFCHTPRNLIVYRNEAPYDKEELFPLGPALLIKSLEDNKNILELRMGNNFPPGRQFDPMPYGLNCCSGPRYEPWITPRHARKLHKYLELNKELYERDRKSRMQEAVVGLADLLLKKGSADGP